MSMLIDAYRFGPAGVTYTRLNPSDKASDILLSAGDLVAQTAATAAGIVRSVQAITGKRYFEAVFTAQEVGGGTIAAGIANNSHALNVALGFSNPNGWAFWGQATGARHNGSTAIADTSLAGDVFGFAVDEPGHNLWIRKNGTWMQGDPETGTSPIWSNLSGTLYAAACPWTTAATITMRFDPASFSHSAPAGFDPITA
jgi:hypothetical protein